MKLIRAALIIGILLVPIGSALAASGQGSTGTGASWLSTVVPAGGDGLAADAIVALSAAGKLAPADAKRRADALRKGAPTYTTTAGATGKVILALAASQDGNPRCAGALDLYGKLQSHGASGRYGTSAWDQSLAIMALRALGATPSKASIDVLLGKRGKNGWNFRLDSSGKDDVTHTALVIVALRAAKVPAKSAALRSAVKWMRSQRTPNGGFFQDRRGRTEANPTALAIQAQRAMGVADAKASKALRALQRPDGSFQYSATDPGSRALATVEALVGLSGKTRLLSTRNMLAAAC